MQTSKKLLALILALVLVLGTFPAAQAADEPLQELALPNGDFETGDASNWTLTGLPENPVRSNEWNEPNTSNTLNLWAHDTEQVEIHAAYTVKLTAGTYRFAFDLSGEGKDSNLRWTVLQGDQVLIQQADTVTTVDWNVWNTIETEEFTLTEPAEITFDFGGTGPVKYWGDLDNLKLFGTGAITEAPAVEAEILLPNGDFETGDASNWTLTGLPENPVRSNEWNEPNTSNTLNLWAHDTEQVEIHAAYTVKLTAGTYRFAFDLSGEGKDSNLRWTVLQGDQVLIQQADTVTTVDWNVWNTIETEAFTLAEPAEVTFDFGGTAPVKYWGDLDNLKLFGTGAIDDGTSVIDVELDHEPTVAVEQLAGVASDDFFRGTDVSSYLSIINSGATFYDYEGNALDEQGFFDLLAKAGFNYIRLRVWNNPFDANGNGYGGGNNDVVAALAMGKWATNAGMKVLIDFHYSDFWADPGKQQVPKAWKGYTVAQKAEAVDAFTYESLKTLLEGGVDVGMVQVGNETTSSICGESSWDNKAQIFSAGSAAVRRISAEYNHDILVAVHFTNPERSGNYANQAKNLANYNVDYDVFASSWYPYWHGTTDNLTTVLKDVAATYNKKVIVAETSWAWTLADGDGHDNTVRNGNNSANPAYSFSVQGQADELVSAAKAILNVGEPGIGVFYWENAWIPVQYAYDENGEKLQSVVEANKQKWEQFGSGWASSYAAEYDPNDAGKWYGGSAVDNQAMFDFTGKALDSLWTWKYMMVGTAPEVEKVVESIEEVDLTLDVGQDYALPETLNVKYNVGADTQSPVVWNAEDLAAVDNTAPGSFTVRGTVATAAGEAEVVAKLTFLAPNLLQNPSFELSDMNMYSLSGGSRTGDDPHTGSRSVHFYNANGGTVELSQTVELTPGTYRFSLFTQGDDKDSTDMYIYVTAGEETHSQSFDLVGWAEWQNPQVDFTVTEPCTVTVGLHLSYGGGGWGTIDDLYLGLLAEYNPPVDPPENPFEDVSPKAFYFDAVLWAVENGVTKGTTDTTFEPRKDCSRADVITFLWRAKGSPEPESSDNPFTDVKPKKYYAKAVLWAVENGITNGTSATTFNPNGPCTRAEVVTFLWRANGKPEPADSEIPFTDVKPKKYYTKAVLWAVENGITTGTGQGLFSPEVVCDRGQVVTFLYREAKGN